jgi:coenzyme F420-dependent glucose-6-phosphate dehydrogenase
MSTDSPPRSNGAGNGAAHIGYSLSTEEHRPEDLVRFAQMAEAAGFEYGSISDHYHPWIDAQGNSPFAWTVLGAIANATTRFELITGITCPTMRYHPAIIAQAAATVASLAPGRFSLGVGTGENLNEHIVGAKWPRYEARAAMLEEAVEIIRRLWTGETVDHEGKHFTVENARLYTLPEQPTPLLVAGSGEKAAALAGRIGDGFIGVTPQKELVEKFEAEAGPSASSGATPSAGSRPEAGSATRANRANGSRPKYLQVNVCVADTEAEARKLAYEICPTVALSGELGNLLPSPTHYQEAVQLLSEDDVAKVILCDPDPEAHVAKLQEGIDAGFDHLHVYQVGPDQERFFRFYEREVLPRLS